MTFCKLSQKFLVLVDPPCVHVLKFGEEGGHFGIEVVSSKGVAFLELKDVSVSTFFSCCFFLSESDGQLGVVGEESGGWE